MGSCRRPSIVSRDDLRLADGQLEALAPHRLDQHRELQLAAALHLPRLRPLGVEHADRDVADRLLLEPAAHHPRRQLRALLADEGRRVDPDRHRQARLVDPDQRQRPRIVGIGQRLADRHLGQAGDGDDLARAGLGRLGPVERLGHVQLGHLDALDLAVRAAPGDLLAALDHAVHDARDREPADVGRRVQVRDERLQRVGRVVDRRGDVLEQGPEERLEVVLELVRPGRRRPPRARVAVHDRELDLVVAGVQVEEQRVGLVDDLGDARVGAIDLVHDEDHAQVGLERLAQHEPGLRQRPLAGVDQEQHAVDHRQGPLHLAAEVGVAGRVDDVDLRVAVPDRGVLGEDRDALLALEIHRVHHALGDVLVGAEGARLPQHRVDQRRLAVVDVRDDGDVPQVLAALHGLRLAVSRRRARSGAPQLHALQTTWTHVS